jgi:hypothetical protein
MSCENSTKGKLLGILDNRKILDSFIGVLPGWNGTYNRDE